jgi:signal transduction histidine kinase/ActR/RegA family two-component response regulator
MIGRSIEICIAENSQAVFKEFKQSFLNTKTPHYSSLGIDTPLTAMTQDVKELPVEVSLSSLNNIHGLQIVHIIRDISVQIETQKQMQIAKENAEALAKARSRFVATMSHEIRTPLNGVLGMSNLLHSTPLNQQQMAYLSAIEYSGQSLLKIINEILDFSKLDEGKLRLESKQFDFAVLVRECILILQTQAEEGQVLVHIKNTLKDSDYFLGDASRIQQILLNLLGNAIKFSPGGRVDIILSQPTPEVDTVGSTTVLIEVKDTGIGIDQATLPRLFDSFSQADESTTRQYGGTGLGLTISKQLVELMGGEIGVSSELAQGSLFWAKLPLKTMLPDISTDQDRTKLQAIATNIPTELKKKLTNKTILLIEDNEINQKIVYEFLKRLGAKVDIAENGVEGLSFWRTHPHKYDLILMDCQMPLMDGYEATQLIRKEEAVSGGKHRIPIVALTANAMNEDQARCLAVGMDDFIAKPIQIDQFNAAIERWSTA